MKIGVNISKIKEGTYIIISKPKFFKFINSIKNQEKYNKIVKFLNFTEIEIKE